MIFEKKKMPVFFGVFYKLFETFGLYALLYPSTTVPECIDVSTGTLLCARFVFLYNCRIEKKKNSQL